MGEVAMLLSGTARPALGLLAGSGSDGPAGVCGDGSSAALRRPIGASGMTAGKAHNFSWSAGVDAAHPAAQ